MAAALLGAIGIAFGLGGMLMLLWSLVVNRLPNENGLWEAIFIGMAMLAAFTAASIWVACLELFRWTYYPIALDRKHRQIHVFRLDGTTLSVPWTGSISRWAAEPEPSDGTTGMSAD